MLEVFRELTISGNSTDLERFIERAAAQLASPWTRETLLEEENAEIANGPEEFLYVFGRTAKGDVPDIKLFFHRSGPKLRVTNIVPKETGFLGRTKYNSILIDFFHQIEKQLNLEPNIEFDLGPDSFPLTNWLSKETTRLLTVFSSSANKSTGRSHPSDYERWMAFVIAAHQEEANLDGEILERWLVEENNWPQDTAFDLAAEYEFARSLLAEYDKR